MHKSRGKSTMRPQSHKNRSTVRSSQHRQSLTKPHFSRSITTIAHTSNKPTSTLKMPIPSRQSLNPGLISGSIRASLFNSAPSSSISTTAKKTSSTAYNITSGPQHRRSPLKALKFAKRLFSNNGGDFTGKWTPAGENGAQGGAPDPEAVLKQFCVDLTQEAREGRLDPMIGRLDILSRVVEVLSRRRKNNPILTGEPGTGKTAIMEGLAQAIVNNQVPEQIRGKKIYSLDMAQLVAGATYRGEFEERLTNLIKALEARDDAILFVDEVHLLVGAGKTEGAMDAANMLKPVLARGKIRFMGATTTKEYTQHIEKDGALARRFEPLHVPEPTVEDCITILRGLKPKYEQHHKVLYRDSAIVAAAQMAKRYFTERRLPDKAIDLLDESGAHVCLESNAKPKILAGMEQDFYRLKMELESLQNDKDPVAVARRKRLQHRLEKLKLKLQSKENEWKTTAQLRDNARIAEQQHEEAKEKISLLLNKQRHSMNPGELRSIDNQLRTYADSLPQLMRNEQEAKKNYEIYLQTKKSDGDEPISTDVTSDVVAHVVAQHTGVPVSKLLVKDKEKLLNLEDELRKRVVAQEAALTAVSTCVRVARAGLHNGQRPQGVFLFCGPSGVGKTELCKALAENLFGSSDAMVRLDMSEYSEAHTVSRLIGAAPGYIGYEEGGQLTEAVRKRPYQVVLLDEIEKAHKQVHTILLQIMEEANLTDGKGHKVDFSNTIFIMTSNLGAHEAQRYRDLNPQLDGKSLANDIMTKAIKQYFPPEFVNRLDDVILFNSLQREHMNSIVRIQLDKVADLLDDHHTSLVVSPAAMNDLADRGFQPEYGARPVKRCIYRHVTQVLAEGILAGIIEDHSLATMRLANEPEVVPEGYDLVSTQGTFLNDKVKSSDPAFVYTIYKKKVAMNKQEERFTWEDDSDAESSEAEVVKPTTSPPSNARRATIVDDDEDIFDDMPRRGGR